MDYGNQLPNRIIATPGQSFYDSNATIGGPSVVVVAGVDFPAATLNVEGMTAFMIAFTLNQAIGGQVVVWFDPCDPITLVPIVEGTIGLGSAAGTGAPFTSVRTLTDAYDIILGNQGRVWLIQRIRFQAAVANATVSNFRLWTSAAY